MNRLLVPEYSLKYLGDRAGDNSASPRQRPLRRRLWLGVLLLLLAASAAGADRASHAARGRQSRRMWPVTCGGSTRRGWAGSSAGTTRTVLMTVLEATWSSEESRARIRILADPCCRRLTGGAGSTWSGAGRAVSTPRTGPGCRSPGSARCARRAGHGTDGGGVRGRGRRTVCPLPSNMASRIPLTLLITDRPGFLELPAAR